MVDTAEIIPFGGKTKDDHLEEMLEEIRSTNYNAAYIVSDNEGRVRYGHTTMGKADLIILTHTLKRLMDYFIEANDISSILYKEEDDGDE